MRRSNELSDQLTTMSTMVELTSAFEGIASLRIAQIRDQVLHSQQFFADLWHIYTQIRVDEVFRSGHTQSSTKSIDKDLLILVTAEGSFSGDIDRRLINDALDAYDSNKNAIVVIGRHGANILAQRGVGIEHSFKTPEHDLNINTGPLIDIVKKYRSTTVYYQQYKSLMSQAIKRIQLSTAIIERGSQVDRPDEIIDDRNYIFEPSTYAVVDHLENSMMQIMLGEVILESKLAQYASRFKAMSLAHERAQDSFSDVNVKYNRARRQEKDERLKETINGLRKAEV
ncbi:MAG TPA: F0F1 ATP synthase subunit gamma [Candidatus Saccharimonadales bacterium]|nr:F0F1 ATP synthase subunit gamma [Candidatus Saccharimonadales bacterium]